MEAMELPVLKFPWLNVPDFIFMTWIVMALLIITATLATRRLRPVPSPLQNVFEVIVEFFEKFLTDVVGHTGPRYLPLIATLGLFILVSNLLGLVPLFKAPTSNLNTTVALALIVFFSYHYFGVKEQGLRAYLSHFIWPIPVLTTIVEVISHIVRPVTLSLRLFGNIWGEDSVILVLFFLKWLVVPYAILLVVMFPLALFTSVVQAFVFIMLSSIYIAGAVEAAHHDEH